MLTRFIEEFIGYGSLQAKTWFIGPEEGGGHNIEELRRRLVAWESLGGLPAVDLFDFHKMLGVSKFFGSRPNLQTTWARLSLVLLSSQGDDYSRDSLRDYQATKLGRTGGETLLGELLPLPKQTVKSWPYTELARECPFLETIKTYRAAVEPERIELLKNAIETYKPKRVVFYSTGRKSTWERVAGLRLQATVEDCYEGDNGITQFLLMEHPNARGVTGKYFATIGRQFRTTSMDHNSSPRISSSSFGSAG